MNSVILSLIFFPVFLVSCDPLPSLEKTSKDPIFAISDEDVYIDCTVTDLKNYTLVWRYVSQSEPVTPSASNVNLDGSESRTVSSSNIDKSASSSSASKGEVLTAGTIRVTSDNRFSVLHEAGTNTWVLQISRVRESDSGIYMCELNTEPVKRISRILVVAAEVDDSTSGSVRSILEVEHNYTGCCAAEKVPKICYHFCNFRGLIGPDTGAVGNGAIQTCINYLPSITKCLADGRDHMPCCVKQNIPDPCRPVCVGNFTLSTVLDHFTCMSYTAPVLACIAEGVQTLPPQPRQVTVEPLSTTQIKLQWAPVIRTKSSPPIDTYQINITQLHSFDAIGTAKIAPSASSSSSSSSSSSPPEPSLYGLQMRYTVSANDSQFIITDLKPYTMYEITMRSVNKAGFSLPINPIRTLTLNSDETSESTSSSGSRSQSSKPPPSSRSKPKPESEGKEESATGDAKSTTEKEGETEREVEEEKTTKNTSQSKLPDMKACCRKNGVTIERCVNILCDPVKADETSLTDLMICAPWANVTFKCMANNIDHSNCCRQRGVTGNCLDFCTGSMSKLDFRHFVCLEHMSTFSSCVLDHFGVLPQSPRNFMVVNVHHDWAILKWLHPSAEKNSPRDSNLQYLVHWRDVSKSDEISPYNVSVASTSPFLLDRLSPGGRYEVYVKTANQYGTSEGSSRVVFSTPPLTTAANAEAEASSGSNQFSPGYNESQCCVRADLSRDCMALCSYRVKVTDVIAKAASCASNLPVLVRCGAGGRNHIPCCRRRAVAEGCLNLCAGLVESSPFVVAARCADEMGKILQCMEEGSGLIPGMPVDFHATLVTKDSIHLAWDAAPEDVNSSLIYQVRYGKTFEDFPLHPLEHDKSQNTSSTNAIVSNLTPGTRYSLYVVASNSYGISLPSLVIVLNTSSSDDSPGTSLVKANIGPPHSIQLLHQSVDSITIKWLPPLYIPPDSRIRYIVHYKPVNGTAAGSKSLEELEAAPWTTSETTYNTMFLPNLTYDTEYALAIQAVSQKDANVKSTLSEVVLVWTDPAIPASVNLPVIIPAGPIYEGSNVTFMCIGIGTPTPQLSLLLNGHEIMREERRHISLTVTSVQRNLTSVSCFASNGFGSGSQSTLELRVRFKPSVHVSGDKDQLAASNAPGRLQCEFTGNPMPHVIWQKDTSDGKQVQVTQDNRVSFVTVAHSDTPLTWINSLVFNQLKPSDAGGYHCSVVNDLGQDSVAFSLTIDHFKNYTNNATGCCVSLGVSPECRKVCTFDVDIDAALQIPQCYPDMDKLMMCAADGSDHRQCCRRKGVPVDCIRWCAGLRVTRPAICSLSASQDIISCFREGKALLPGPPADLHSTHMVDENKILIDWHPPKKNAELVTFYRVFWRPVGSRDLNKNQTDKPHFELEGLDGNKLYEVVVRSGNHYGLSTFTDPLVISMHSTRASSLASSILQIITGISITALIVIAIGAVALYAYKNHLPTIQSIRLRSSLSNLTTNNNNNNHNNNNHSSRGVSFENPSYMKDSGPVVQFSPPSNVEVNANFPS